MRFRKLLRQITPPILVTATRPFRQRRQQPVEWEYIPEGWAYAHGHPAVKGWDVPGVLATYQRKWPRFVELVQGTGPLGLSHETPLTTRESASNHNMVMTFGYALALAARHRDRLTVLDWGGGIGHYYLLAQALLPDVAIEYHCRDLPLLCTQGAQLFPDQFFYTDDSCLRQRYDFVLASSSLQYAQDWRNVLQRLVAATAGYLFIANLPIVQQTGAFVFVQRPYHFGYATEYLAWCLNQNELLATAAGAGAQLVREFVYAFVPHIQHAPEQCTYRGYLFRHQGPASDPGAP